LDKGADLFVTKPIGAQELKETISRLLKAGPKKPAPVKNPGTGNRAKAKKKRR
jgi:DNA-binding response OmpR family regulator